MLDDAFDLMFSVLNDQSQSNAPELHSNPEVVLDSSPKYSAAIAAATDKIRNIKPPIHRSTSSAPHVFDKRNDVLDWKVRHQFESEWWVSSLPFFSVLRPTTNTIEGYLSNVLFHERELIQEVMPDASIVQYHCNYGKITYEGYTEVTKVRTTNRGRKKKPKRKRRRLQGNGTDFNSQITCVVLSTLAPPPDQNGRILMGSRIHKIKVFRTGKIQVPGVHQSIIDDAIICAQMVAQNMNFHLHAMETDPSKTTSLINMNPVMKNYKFAVNLPAFHIIDLNVLRDILMAGKESRWPSGVGAGMSSETARSLEIFAVRYTREDTKLSINIITPIPNKPNKKTRINIFMRGRVNILGAFYFNITMQIYNFLHALFSACYCDLVVPEGEINAIPHDQMLMWATCTANIKPLSTEETERILGTFASMIAPPAPIVCTDEENAAINDLINEIAAGNDDIDGTDNSNTTGDPDIDAFINEFI